MDDLPVSTQISDDVLGYLWEALQEDRRKEEAQQLFHDYVLAVRMGRIDVPQGKE